MLLSWAKILYDPVTLLTAFSRTKFLKVICGTFADERNALIDKPCDIMADASNLEDTDKSLLCLM